MATVSVPRPTSLLMLLVVYLGTFIGGVSLFYILAYVVEAYFDTPFPDNNSMGIILMVVSAVITGTFWYNREKADPSSARKWKLALLLTIATVAIQLGIVALLVSALEQVQQLTREFNGGDRPIIIGAVVGIILLEFLLLRAGIWWGVRNGIKSQARIIGKA